MRRCLYTLWLLHCLVGCRPDDARILPTSDNLYRTWRLTKADINGTDVTNQYIRVVTFRRDGKFGNGQQSSSCCAPVSFEGNDSTLRFIWDTSDPQCALINCILSPLFDGAPWHISTLTADKLVFTRGETTLVYEPAP